MTMEKCLYIIGNGFALAHAALSEENEKKECYKTRYSDYRAFLFKKSLYRSSEGSDISKRTLYCFLWLKATRILLGTFTSSQSKLIAVASTVAMPHTYVRCASRNTGTF